MACDRHPALTCFRGVCCGRGNVPVSMAHSIHHLACSWIDQNSPIIDNRVAAARENAIFPSTQPLPASPIRAKAAIYDILFKTWNRDADSRSQRTPSAWAPESAFCTHGARHDASPTAHETFGCTRRFVHG